MVDNGSGQGPPRNKGGRPSNAERAARDLAQARGAALSALRRAVADPETPASTLPQLAREIRELVAELSGSLDSAVPADEEISALLGLKAQLIEQGMTIAEFIAQRKAFLASFGELVRAGHGVVKPVRWECSKCRGAFPAESPGLILLRNSLAPPIETDPVGEPSLATEAAPASPESNHDPSRPRRETEWSHGDPSDPALGGNGLPPGASKIVRLPLRWDGGGF